MIEQSLVVMSVVLDEDGGALTGTLTATDVDGLADGTIFSIESADQAPNGTARLTQPRCLVLYAIN